MKEKTKHSTVEANTLSEYTISTTRRVLRLSIPPLLLISILLLVSSLIIKTDYRKNIIVPLLSDSLPRILKFQSHDQDVYVQNGDVRLFQEGELIGCVECDSTLFAVLKYWTSKQNYIFTDARFNVELNKFRLLRAPIEGIITLYHKSDTLNSIYFYASNAKFYIHLPGSVYKAFIDSKEMRRVDYNKTMFLVNEILYDANSMYLSRRMPRDYSLFEVPYSSLNVNYLKSSSGRPQLAVTSVFHESVFRQVLDGF